MNLNQAEASEPAEIRSSIKSMQIADLRAPVCFPLSPEQRGIWRRQCKSGIASRNIARAFRLVGPLDTGALRWSLREIARGQHILRAAIVLREGQPTHLVDDSVTITPVITESNKARAIEHEVLVQAWLKDEIERPFELADAPLMRVSLLRIDKNDHCLVIVAHPILFADDLSISVLLGELGHFYTQLIAGNNAPRAVPVLQYSDFVEWQRDWLQSAEMRQSLDYWTKKLATLPAALDLPADRPRPLEHVHGRNCEHITIAHEVEQGLDAVAHAQETSLFVVLLSAYQALLRRYTRQDDIVVIVTSEQRVPQRMAKTIGHFANLLPLRVNLPGNPDFPVLVAFVRDAVAEADANQSLPFETLQETLCDEHRRDGDAFAQVAFTLRDATADELVMRNLVVTQIAADSGKSRFDLALLMRQGPDGLEASLEYRTDIFEPATATRMLRHFGNLLDGIVKAPDAKLSALPILSEQEIRQQLVEWNQAVEHRQEPRCLHELVEDQARRTPDAIAVVGDGQSLTYRELNRRANRIAWELRRNGGGPDVLVAACFERSVEMVVGVLGVLKAGCAYLPINPMSPREQIDMILDDAEVGVLLTHSRHMPVLPAGCTIICIDTCPPEVAGDEADLGRIASPTNLAYMIYTSGSTGKPKGVMIPHQGVCNTILAMQATFQLTPTDRVLQRCAFIWDPSICEIFLTLMAGARLVIAPPDPLVATAEFSSLIRRHGITCVMVVPSLLQTLLDNEALEDCTCLRHVFCGGETLPPQLVEAFFRKSNASLHNLYGPTEASIWSTYWTCQPEVARRVIPIGRPFSSHEVFILDSHSNPVPVGVIGELHIGGAGVARGYWRRPELNRDKFIPHPFNAKSNSRLYRTGDLARYLSDGTIEYVGREDFQIKIRGFRVELGEIEARLAACPGVRNALVLAREDTSGDKRLVAYLTAQDDAELSVPDIRLHLAKGLEEFMVPSAFLVLDSFPKTASGKLDRKALPMPQYFDTKMPPYEAPVGAIETAIAAIWQTVLGLDQVGRHDHFFFDLGGHSLLAVRSIAMLRKQMGTDLPLASLFQVPTVAGLAAFVADQRAVPAERTKPLVLRGAWSPLVEITKANGRPPLFCIHGAKGNVLIFSDLARQLGPQQPLFGFQARGIDGRLPAFNSVEDLVECYRSEIRRVCPTGPYFLLGYSIGGTIAFELAKQLSEADEHVALVALVDTICPPALADVQKRPARKRLARGFAKGQALAIQMHRLSKWPRYYWARYLALRGRVVPFHLRENYVANSLEIIFTPLRPKPYGGKIVLFRALPEETGLGLSPELGWEDLAEGVDVCYGQGSHDTIIRLPNIGVFAERLRPLLQIEDGTVAEAAIRPSVP